MKNTEIDNDYFLKIERALDIGENITDELLREIIAAGREDILKYLLSIDGNIAIVVDEIKAELEALKQERLRADVSEARSSMASGLLNRFRQRKADAQDADNQEVLNKTTGNEAVVAEAYEPSLARSIYDRVTGNVVAGYVDPSHVVVAASVPEKACQESESKEFYDNQVEEKSEQSNQKDAKSSWSLKGSIKTIGKSLSDSAEEKVVKLIKAGDHVALRRLRFRDKYRSFILDHIDDIAKDANATTILVKAIKDGDLLSVKALVEDCGAGLYVNNLPRHAGRNEQIYGLWHDALTTAVKYGHVEIAKYLNDIIRSQNNVQKNEEADKFVKAIKKAHGDKVFSVLPYRNLVSGFGYTPLQSRVDLNVLMFELNGRTSFSPYTRLDYNKITYSIDEQRPSKSVIGQLRATIEESLGYNVQCSILPILPEIGKSVGVVENSGFVRLIFSVNHYNNLYSAKLKQIVKLLDEGVNPDSNLIVFFDEQGVRQSLTALEYAITINNFDLVRLLLDRGADFNNITDEFLDKVLEEYSRFEGNDSLGLIQRTKNIRELIDTKKSLPVPSAPFLPGFGVDSLPAVDDQQDVVFQNLPRVNEAFGIKHELSSVADDLWSETESEISVNEKKDDVVQPRANVSFLEFDPKLLPDIDESIVFPDIAPPSWCQSLDIDNGEKEVILKGL